MPSLPNKRQRYYDAASIFFKCPSVKKIIKEIEAIFNRSGLTANIEIKELNIILGLYGGEDLDVILIP
jgi:hypothetical protein